MKKSRLVLQKNKSRFFCFSAEVSSLSVGWRDIAELDFGANFGKSCMDEVNIFLIVKNEVCKLFLTMDKYKPVVVICRTVIGLTFAYSGKAPIDIFVRHIVLNAKIPVIKAELSDCYAAYFFTGAEVVYMLLIADVFFINALESGLTETEQSRSLLFLFFYNIERVPLIRQLCHNESAECTAYKTNDEPADYIGGEVYNKIDPCNAHCYCEQERKPAAALVTGEKYGGCGGHGGGGVTGRETLIALGILPDRKPELIEDAVFIGIRTRTRNENFQAAVGYERAERYAEEYCRSAAARTFFQQQDKP